MLTVWGRSTLPNDAFGEGSQLVPGRPDTVPSGLDGRTLGKDRVTHNMHRTYYYDYEELKAFRGRNPQQTNRGG